MSVSYNHVILAGNLTRDPQVRTAGSGSVANFGMAVSRRRKGADGAMIDETTFVDVEAWGRTGELVGQYLVKGSPAYIEGRLKLDSWEDKEGKKQSRLRVVAETVQFLGKARAGDAGPEREAAPSGSAVVEAATAQPRRPAPPTPSDDPDDPPF